MANPESSRVKRGPDHMGESVTPRQAAEAGAMVQRYCAPFLYGLPRNLLNHVMTNQAAVMARAAQHLFVPSLGKSAGERKVRWIPWADYILRTSGRSASATCFGCKEVFEPLSAIEQLKITTTSDFFTKPLRVVVYEALEEIEFMEVAWVHLGFDYEEHWNPRFLQKSMPFIASAVEAALWPKKNVFEPFDLDSLFHSEWRESATAAGLPIGEGAHVFPCGTVGIWRKMAVATKKKLPESERPHGSRNYRWQVALEGFGEPTKFDAGTMFYFVEPAGEE